jgi:hypothetical protein
MHAFLVHSHSETPEEAQGISALGVRVRGREPPRFALPTRAAACGLPPAAAADQRAQAGVLARLPPQQPQPLGARAHRGHGLSEERPGEPALLSRMHSNVKGSPNVCFLSARG